MECAHPQILHRLQEINFEKNSGYGTDRYCDSAKGKIRMACACPDAEVFFLVGGTQTNATVIKTVLHSYEGVVAADSGHISVHEAGAIELGGHKVLTIPNQNGKLTAEAVDRYLKQFYADGNHDHMVFPGMIYISHPTEYGTLYTKSELEQLHKVCAAYNLPLYLDGARMGYGLAAEDTDVTLPVIAENCDVFYIGGTKVGALFGEAVVWTNSQLAGHFFTIMKQQGALLAKGWILGVQFDELFTDDLYYKISRNAIEMARQLKEGLIRKGYTLYFDSPTNQQFIVLENNRMKELAEQVSFSFWETVDDHHTAVRFATSWATTTEQVEKLLDLL